jgi:hypothetical protein
MKQYSKQKEEKNKEVNELAEIEYKEKLEKFLKTEGKLVSASSESSSKPTETSVCNMKGDLKNKLASFWVPSLCPESTSKLPMKKPVNNIHFFIYLYKQKNKKSSLYLGNNDLLSYE